MFISPKAVVFLLAAVTSVVAKKEHNCNYAIPLKKDAAWALETFTGTECRYTKGAHDYFSESLPDKQNLTTRCIALKNTTNNVNSFILRSKESRSNSVVLRLYYDSHCKDLVGHTQNPNNFYTFGGYDHVAQYGPGNVKWANAFKLAT
ncbi:hypothetical protein BV22DRAFT_246123 [Leucogyrophana mollusca]|uniref:Uncharacterized protein n=1 Tax=Leucogyrophana mollusca TaxID=85980 RepID=A0ACB8BRU3_9AGAM|nr:hypothetical protein BV22DRAFT_246123 [Leucogyrophana mollusca]